MKDKSHTEPKSDIDKLAELIAEIRIAMLTTVAENGRLWSRPITTQRAAFDGNLWFITKLDSPKVLEVARHRQVSLTYARPDKNAYVSVSGTAQLVRDSAKAKQLWDPSYESWFPGGPTDPHLALLCVTIDRAEYWDAPALTWPFEAGFVVLDPEQARNPEFHARITWHPDDLSSGGEKG